MVKAEYTPPTEHQNEILCIILGIDAFLYVSMILWGLIHVYKYLYKMGLYKIFFLSVFYSMSILILTLRFTMVVNYYRYN